LLTVVKADSLQAPLQLKAVTAATRPALFAAALTSPPEIETLGTTELVAQRLGRLGRSIDASRVFGEPQTVTIPEEALVLLGTTGSTVISLELDSVDRPGHLTCKYRRDRRLPKPVGENTRAESFQLDNCTGGARAGTSIEVNGVTLHVLDGGKHQQDTTVRMVLNDAVTEPAHGDQHGEHDQFGHHDQSWDDEPRKPARPHACESLDLSAIAAPTKLASHTAEADLGHTARFELPQTIEAASDASCGRTVTLSYRQRATDAWTECSFVRRGSSYDFRSCTDGSTRRFDARYVRLGFSAASSNATTEQVRLTLHEQAPCGDLGPRTIPDADGAVFSSLRGELYLLGSNGTQRSPDAYVGTLATSSWRRVQLEATSSIADVVAATYVASEQRLYFVESGTHGLRLGRWDTSSAHVEWLHTFLEQWRLGTFWLTQSLDGRLVFASSASFDDRSVLALLQSTNGQNIVVDQVADIDGVIFGPPIADHEGVSLDIATGPNFDDIRQARIPYDEFCNAEHCLEQN
jgi:hypothetical protein